MSDYSDCEDHGSEETFYETSDKDSIHQDIEFPQLGDMSERQKKKNDLINPDSINDDISEQRDIVNYDNPEQVNRVHDANNEQTNRQIEANAEGEERWSVQMKKSDDTSDQDSRRNEVSRSDRLVDLMSDRESRNDEDQGSLNDEVCLMSDRLVNLMSDRSSVVSDIPSGDVTPTDQAMNQLIDANLKALSTTKIHDSVMHSDEDRSENVSNLSIDENVEDKRTLDMEEKTFDAALERKSGQTIDSNEETKVDEQLFQGRNDTQTPESNGEAPTKADGQPLEKRSDTNVQSKNKSDFNETNARIHGQFQEVIKKSGIRVLQPPGGFSSGLW